LIIFLNLIFGKFFFKEEKKKLSQKKGFFQKTFA
jgi:hypothetical protein